MRNVPILLAACALLAGCSPSLSTRDVHEFIDKADDAARKRFAPEICGLRGKSFQMHVTFQGHEQRLAPTELIIDRKLFCKEAGSFSQLRQYRLERKSLDIDLADDRRTARVNAKYVETMPYYSPHTIHRTLDDFLYFQIVESEDESVVGYEDGDLVFLSTRAKTAQSLVPKRDLDLPYD
jgi:hypothetical protein